MSAGFRIRLTWERVDPALAAEGGDRIAFAVADTGIGAIAARAAVVAIGAPFDGALAIAPVAIGIDDPFTHHPVVGRAV